MAEDPKVHTYTVGDVIAFEVTIDHEANLQDTATAYLESPETSPGYISCPSEAHHTTRPSRRKQHLFRFKSEFKVGVGPYHNGEYRLTRIEVETVGGKKLSVGRLPDVRCAIVLEEPLEQPQFRTFEWISEA